MLGAHLSISGGLHNALLKAEQFKLDTVQIFTKNQQQWRVPPLKPETINEWATHCQRLGFLHTVSHDSYLINLASPDEPLWKRSINLFIEEFARCSALRIPYLVMHPGCHMGRGEDWGLGRVVDGLDRVWEAHPRGGVVVCLEITAGQGSAVGWRLEQLAGIIQRVGSPNRLGVCLDTAHLWAAGYDFRGRKYAGFMKEVEKTVGRWRIKVIHLNDSKKELGSRVDRHDHIGQGTIGLDGFRPFMRDRELREVPKIIETPKATAADGREWDEINIETLRGLMGRNA
jgi:deoxyribonuclease-4